MMARTDDDSWDLASSVGMTATMVAAQRVLANREGLIDDPFAEPFVRAVGMDFFTKALDGEIDWGTSIPGSACSARQREWLSAPGISTGCSPTRPQRVGGRR
jgi:O-methyltransferase involved in polyketide biosynthesis